MINKKFISYSICLFFSLACTYMLRALNIPDTISFYAGVDLRETLKLPEAHIHYRIKDSGERDTIKPIPFHDPEALLLFGDDITQDFVTQSVFDEEAYFPNDIPVSLELRGEDPRWDMMNTLTGEVLILRNEVRPPGIEYFLTARDSRTRQWSFGTTILNISYTLSKKLTPSGGIIVFPDTNPHDGDVQLVFPPGAVGQDIIISVTLEETFTAISQGSTQLSPNLGSNGPVVVYDFSSTRYTPYKGFEVSLLYHDNDSTPGIVDGTNINELDLAIYWHDGFEWRPLGGTVNPEDNLITVTMGHFARLGIFPAAPLSKDQYRPKRKIITPALVDGTNDFAQFDNLAGRTDVAIKIFDITGRKIRTIHAPYSWDGRDDDGDIVESGVYIYQFDVDGTLISGTIAVAK